MGLITQKDFRGHAAVMATCKPSKEWRAWEKAKHAKRRKKPLGKEPSLFLEPDRAPGVFETLYEYCKIDVLSEEELDDALPDLNRVEQEIWFLNQKLNWRGLRVDVPTIQKIVGIMEVETKKGLKELDSLTMGLVTKPGARQSIIDFLASEGIELKDMRAQTVKDALQAENLNDDMKRLLQLRQELSKTSTKKYQSFLDRANEDGRVRDILLYHGASTGRDTGTGVQIHNLPKPLIEQNQIEDVIELLEGALND